MLVVVAIVIMFTVAYSQCREGLLAAVILSINVLLASILAVNFWEPLADELDGLFSGDMLAGYEDALTLTFLFSTFLILLRMAAGKFLPKTSSFSGYMQQLGGGLFGLLAGYLVAGFLVCVLQTLPWHEHFLSFRPHTPQEPVLRRLMPPDRVWLDLMRHAGQFPLAWKEAKQDGMASFSRYQTFDSGKTFEARYLRYRRYGDTREPFKYEGEFDRELGKEKPR